MDNIEVKIMKRKLAVITCPTCGREYLPAEIFLPNVFFGRPLNIRRSMDEKIIDFDGESLNTSESYYCEKCNIPFNVISKISFDTKVNISVDFDNDYIRKIPQNLIFNEN